MNIDDAIITESTARTILLTAMRDAAAYLRDDAIRRLDSTNDASLAFDHYTDSDDYSPSAARFLATLTATIYDTDTYDQSALARLNALLADDDFRNDAEVCDFSTPLLALIIDE